VAAQEITILDAATSAFLADGYAATTIEAIAQTCRIAKRTIYARWSGKPGCSARCWNASWRSGCRTPATGARLTILRTHSTPQRRALGLGPKLDKQQVEAWLEASVALFIRGIGS
jgi:Bacterial regulatory proteins, tetR family